MASSAYQATMSPSLLIDEATVNEAPGEIDRCKVTTGAAQEAVRLPATGEFHHRIVNTVGRSGRSIRRLRTLG